jgi:hypothetical protein
MGGGLGVDPASLPFWVVVINYYVCVCVCEWYFSDFGGGLDFSIWPPDLAGFRHIWWTFLFILFLKLGSLALIGNFPTSMWNPMTGPHGRQPLGHANHFHSHLPRQPDTSSYHIIFPCHHMVCHMVLRTATWCVSIGPWKIQK